VDVGGFEEARPWPREGSPDPTDSVFLRSSTPLLRFFSAEGRQQKNKFFTSEGRRRCSRRRSTTPSTTRRCNVVICIGLLDYVIGGREGEVATLTTEKKWRE